MEKQTMGTVVAVKKQWWLKVNTKPIRVGALDGAIFPHIIKVEYVVDGVVYTKRKWINAGEPVPKEGGTLRILYDENKHKKAKIL